MKLFGYKGCKIDRSDSVGIQRKHSDQYITIAEQLTTAEAEDCYETLKMIYNNENNYIEIIDVDNIMFFIPKDEIGKIQWNKNNYVFYSKR